MKWLVLFFLTLLVASPLWGVKPITDRNNVASNLFGSRAYVIHKDGSKVDADKVLTSNYTDGNATRLEGVPSELIIEFPAPTQINLIRIYPGVPLYAPYPSGDCGITDYKIEALNNGYWHLMAEGKEQPNYRKSGAESNGEYVYEHNFRPFAASAIKITVTRSGATGRSASNDKIVPEADRISHIRAVEVYEAAKAKNRLARLSTMVKGDFPLAVYRSQKQAVLKLWGDFYLKPTLVSMTVTGEKSGKVMEERQMELVTGEQKIDFDLAKYPDGRYFVTIKPVDENGSIKGELKRLLRIDRGGDAALPAEPVTVTGRKIFPIDDFHFAKRENIRTVVVPAEVIQATTEMTAPGRGVQVSRGGRSFDRDELGNYVIEFTDATRGGNDRKTHYAISRDLKKWEVVDRPPSGKENSYSQTRFAPLPAPATPKWQEKTPFKEANIRSYDADKDGIPPLNEVRVQWFPPSMGDAKAKGLTPWGFYSIWEKNKGEWIVLTPEPLMVLKFYYEGDELDKEVDGNDNFAPQFLSDDGKTLYYSVAAKPRRFAPYTIEYDNLNDALRLMRTFYTTDGIHWQTRFLTLPDENDHWTYQHYGLFSFRVTDDLYLGYLHAYHSGKQQIYPEIIYSRDGLNWKRIAGSEPFIANTPPGTWLFGMIFLEGFPRELDDKYYLTIGTAYRRQHFYNTYRDDLSDITAESLRRSYTSRNLEKEWPFFQEIGGWEGLAKDMRSEHASIGLAVFRKDGWLAARSEGNGLLESRLFTAPGATLILNGKGKFMITLTDSAGKLLPGYTARIDGDGVALPVVFENGKPLPDTPFRIKIEISEGSELYTLMFQ